MSLFLILLCVRAHINVRPLNSFTCNTNDMICWLHSYPSTPRLLWLRGCTFHETNINFSLFCLSNVDGQIQIQILILTVFARCNGINIQQKHSFTWLVQRLCLLLCLYIHCAHSNSKNDPHWPPKTSNDLQWPTMTSNDLFLTTGPLDHLRDWQH